MPTIDVAMSPVKDEKTHPEYARILRELSQRPVRITYETIAERADVSVSWLTQFGAGKIKDASFNRVMRVRDALRAIALEAAQAE